LEAEELDFAIDELEIRLERLRALYEQYFLGIEKLEPQVARKDVDRRIFVLRREKIRNTGRRFKLQTLIQRYNTFQQYWQRICREIENGTYKRHLIRAEKIGPTTLLTVAARRRFGKERAPAQADAAAAAAAQPSASQFPEPPQDEVTERRIKPADVAPPPQPEASDSAVPRARSRVPTLPGLSSAPPPPLSVPPPERISPPAARPIAASASPAPSPPAARPAARLLSSRAPRGPSPFESLELDMDFMGDWDPGAGRVRGGAAATNDARPPAARAPAAAAAPAPAPERRLAPPPKPARVAAKPSAPEPEPAARVAAKPSAPEPAASSPSAAAAPAAVAAKPAKAAQPQKPVQAQKSAARPATSAGETSVSDGKLKELHQRFTEASKSAGQPAVSFEGLSKSLRAAEAKLRQQHGNRRIDFEVVLKDGKPVVKPVVR
jgi:hypothetical protein